MGNKTRIKANQLWSEPPILWTLVGTGSGTRKTAALNLIITPLIEMQRNLTRQWNLSRPTSSSSYDVDRAPQIIAGALSTYDLNSVLSKNEGQITCIVEDMECFHANLGASDSKQIKRKVCDWYDGVPGFEVSLGQIKMLESTCFNHTGFVKPEYMMDIHMDKKSWLGSRYLISCTQFPNHGPILNSNPVPQGTPSFKSMFQTLYTYHQQSREYVFSEEAWTELANCHDNEWTSLLLQFDQDQNKRAAIEKSLGQIVRVAGVLKALENASIFSKQPSDLSAKVFQWDLTVGRDTLCRAIDLCKYFVDQKLALLLGSGGDLGMCNYVGSSRKWVNAKDALRQLQQVQDIKQQQPIHHSNPHQSQHQQLLQQHHHQQRLHHDNTVVYLSENSSASMSTAEEWADQSQIEDVQDETQTADFMVMDKQMFVSVHAKRIKRLLECFDDGYGVSATTASQKSITPPVKIQGTNNRHPVWASALFFQKCHELGLGSAEQVKHPTNRKFYWRFKRKPVSELTDKLQQLLTFLRVDMSLYSRIGPRQKTIPPVSPGLLYFTAIEDSSDSTEGRQDATSMDDMVNGSMESVNDQGQMVVKAEPL